MLNKSKDEGRALPRIQSQKRVHTAFEKKENNRELLDKDKKVEPSNRQLKRAFSTTNTCKAVRYENTGILYTKKIAELENQSMELEREIKRVQQEILLTKKNSLGKNRKIEASKDPKSNFITEITDETQSRATLGAAKNLNNQKVVLSQIKIAENRLQIMRKKMDEQTERNKKMRKQVDAVRKQINTLKELNKNCQATLSKTSEQFQQYSELSKSLDEEIANKNILMHKTKVQNQHKKAEMIRQYNQILKCLEKELEENKAKDKDRSSKADSQYLYVTQFDQKSTIATDLKSDRNPKFSQISLRKSKGNIPSQISTIRAKLEKYEKQFEQVKTKTGTRTTDQVIKQYESKYEQNFDLYKYVNQLYASLREKEKENQELKRQRDQLIEETSNRASEAKSEQIWSMRIALETAREEKVKYSGLCQEFEKFMEEIKDAIGQFYLKVDMKQTVNQPISEENVIRHLVDIREYCRELDDKFEAEQQKTDNQNLDLDLAQMLENAKKESMHETDPKNDRMMNREDFIKARETFMKKKPTPRRPLSKR